MCGGNKTSRVLLAGFSQFQGMWLFTVNWNDKVKQIKYAPTRYLIGFLSKLYNMFFIKWRAESCQVKKSPAYSFLSSAPFPRPFHSSPLLSARTVYSKNTPFQPQAQFSA